MAAVRRHRHASRAIGEDNFSLLQLLSAGHKRRSPAAPHETGHYPVVAGDARGNRGGSNESRSERAWEALRRFDARPTPRPFRFLDRWRYTEPKVLAPRTVTKMQVLFGTLAALVLLINAFFGRWVPVAVYASLLACVVSPWYRRKLLRRHQDRP